jgi:hypothetical protein
MALNNCTINSASVNVTQGQALNNTANQVLTITPDSGYRVSASDFTNNTGTLPASINSITLSNSSTAYAANNNVLVTVDLKNSFVANTNVTLTIDIDGRAVHEKLVPYTWDGNRIVSGNNVQNTGTSSLTQRSNIAGNQATVDSFALEASSGYYFPEEPGDPTIAGSYSGSHVIESSVVTDSNSRIIKKNYIVNYTFPSLSTTGNNITYSANAVAVPTIADEITGIRVDTRAVNAEGQDRKIQVFGSKVTSKFTITITRGNNDTYDFSTNTFTSTATNSGTITVGSTFSAMRNIEIPANASGDTYNVKIAAVSPTSVASSVNNYNNSNPTFTWTQAATATIIVTANSVAETFTKTYLNNSVNVSLNLKEDQEPRYNLTNLTMNITHASRNLYLRRQPVFSNEYAYNTSGTSDFTNTVPASNNGTDFTLEGLSASGNGTQTLVISAKNFEIHSTGSSGVSSVLALDNIINRPPVTSVSSFTANPTGNTTHGVTASDPQNDTLTYIVTTAPTKGTVTIASTGVATYARTALASGNDFFDFKVNDGYEDSNVSRVSITAGSSTIFSYNTVYKYKDLGGSNPNTEYNLSGVFSGTLTATNFVAGSSNDLTIKVSNWSLDAVHAGIPTYMDGTTDYDEVFYRLKNNSGTVVNHGSIPINYGNCTFSSSARTGSVETYVLDTNTNNLANEPHTLEIVLHYDDNPNP